MRVGLQKDFQVKTTEPLSDDGGEAEVTAGHLEQMSNITPSHSTKLDFGFLLEFVDDWLISLQFMLLYFCFQFTCMVQLCPEICPVKENYHTQSKGSVSV